MKTKHYSVKALCAGTHQGSVEILVRATSSKAAIQKAILAMSHIPSRIISCKPCPSTQGHLLLTTNLNESAHLPNV